LEIDEETSPFLFGIDGIDDLVALKKKTSDFVCDNVFRDKAFMSTIPTGKL
jgi:hypothetical protein